MKKFTDWFQKNLFVGRYPTPQEVERLAFDVYINVSDEYIYECHLSAMRSGKQYHWFPLNECFGDIGLNSIYAALQILYIAEQNNKKVYLHCHAGANRSPTVADAYYFLRTKTHRITNKKLNDVSVNFDSPQTEPSRVPINRLMRNIESGHLPAINQMERFLKECELSFQKEIAYKGGMIDYCKDKAQIG
jgi:hypothetical protein